MGAALLSARAEGWGTASPAPVCCLGGRLWGRAAAPRAGRHGGSAQHPSTPQIPPLSWPVRFSEWTGSPCPGPTLGAPATMHLSRTGHQAHIPTGQGPVVAGLPGRAAHPSAPCQSATPRAVSVPGQPGPHWPPARAGSAISHFHIQEVTAAVLIYNPEVWPWKLRVPACNALGSLHTAILPAPSELQKEGRNACWDL